MALPAPTAMPPMIQARLCEPESHSVTTITTAMAAAAIWLPRTAVRGDESSRSPKMKAAASDHGPAQAPVKGTGKAGSPCQQMAACQAVTATTAGSANVTFVPLAAASVAHEPFEPLQASSRPPDRNLRPPIQL